MPRTSSFRTLVVKFEQDVINTRLYVSAWSNFSKWSHWRWSSHKNKVGFFFKTPVCHANSTLPDIHSTTWRPPIFLLPTSPKMSRVFCIPGIIFLFCAFVLSFLVSISTPFLPALDIARVHFDNRALVLGETDIVETRVRSSLAFLSSLKLTVFAT